MFAVAAAPSSSSATPLAAFPTAAVQACLSKELIAAVQSIAAVKGMKLPAATSAVAGAAIDVDSLVVVSILCAVEPIIGMELPESVVRTGGYSSVQSAIDHMVPCIEAHWASKKGVKP